VSLHKIFLAYFLLLSFPLLSQNSNILTPFEKDVQLNTEILTKESNFKKARSFFLEREWDSTLFYTSKILIEENQKKVKDYSYFLRGVSFKEKKNFKGAKYEFSRIQKNYKLYAYVRSFLGQIALEESKFEKAVRIFKELDEKNWGEDVKGLKISNIKHNLGLCYLHLKKFDKSEQYLKNSINLYEKQKDTFELVGAYGDIANVYYEQYKDDIAIPYFQKAYQLAKHVSNFELKQNTAKNMAVVEENRKDLTAALQYRKEYEQWKDSLNNQNKIWEIAQLEKKVAIQQKQQEVNVLTAENRANIAERNGLLYSAGVLVLLLATGIYFYKEKLKANKLINIQNKRLDSLNATKDKLFSIVSHDLRSSVNTLKLRNKKLIQQLEKDNIIEVHQLLKENSNLVGSAYNLLDNLLNWSLLQTKQSYFEIQKNHLFYTVEQVVYNYLPFIEEKKLHFENTISKQIKVLADQESLKMILRNLLDNAIKFSNTNDQIKLNTEVSKKGYIDIIIEDSGIGMRKEVVAQLQAEEILVHEKENKERIGSGLGLQLCKSMIQKNKGMLSIESVLGKGTKMIVSLPKPPN